MDVPNIGALWQCLGRLSGRQQLFLLTQTQQNWGQLCRSCFFLWAASPWLCSLPRPTCRKQNNSFPKKQNPPLKPTLHPTNFAKSAKVFFFFPNSCFSLFVSLIKGRFSCWEQNQLCSDISVLAWRSLNSPRVLEGGNENKNN